jgi:hypothetical protein
VDENREDLKMKRKWIFIAPAAILGMLLFVAIGGAVVRLLWNWLLPPLFGWPQVTLWQALGLLALCRILFGGLGRHGGPQSSVRRRMQERWEGQTPEEREKFRQAMRARWGFGPPTSESKGRPRDGNHKDSPH